MLQIRVEPAEESDFSWEHNRFTLGDGAVNEHPLGTVSYILPVDPNADHIPQPLPQEFLTEIEDLGSRMHQVLDADEADGAADSDE